MNIGEVLQNSVIFCYAEFDYIGKYESLIDDSRNILTLLNVTDFIKFPENRTDKYEKRSGKLVDEYFKMVPKKIYTPVI